MEIEIFEKKKYKKVEKRKARCDTGTIRWERIKKKAKLPTKIDFMVNTRWDHELFK
jgi:hypothetical protein